MKMDEQPLRVAWWRLLAVGVSDRREYLSGGAFFLVFGCLSLGIFGEYLISGIAIVLGAPVFLGQLWGAFWRAWRVGSGPTCHATVLAIRSGEIRGLKRLPFKVLRYFYTVPETGEKKRVESPPLPPEWKGAWRVGDPLRIVYSPTNPDWTFPWSSPPSESERIAWERARGERPPPAAVPRAAANEVERAARLLQTGKHLKEVEKSVLRSVAAGEAPTELERWMIGQCELRESKPD